MRHQTLGLLLLLSVSPACAQTDLDDSYPIEAPAEWSVVHRLVSAEFVDPSSAQYKQMVLVTQSAGRHYLCGWVNARNSFGGYTPFYPFYVSFADDQVNIGQDYADEILGPLTRLTFEIVGCAKPLGLPPS